MHPLSPLLSYKLDLKCHWIIISTQPMSLIFVFFRGKTNPNELYMIRSPQSTATCPYVLLLPAKQDCKYIKGCWKSPHISHMRSRSALHRQERNDFVRCISHTYLKVNRGKFKIPLFFTVKNTIFEWIICGCDRIQQACAEICRFCFGTKLWILQLFPPFCATYENSHSNKKVVKDVLLSFFTADCELNYGFFY